MKCHSCKKSKNKDGSSVTNWRCKECHKKQERYKYRANPVKFSSRRNKWREENRTRQREIDKRSRRKLKVDALNAYSKNNPICVCCKEKEIEFLCLDHIDDDGNKNRKTTGTGNTFYFWLRKNKYPKLRIQLLCYNCNNSKKNGGICVHKR